MGILSNDADRIILLYSTIDTLLKGTCTYFPPYYIQLLPYFFLPFFLISSYIRTIPFSPILFDIHFPFCLLIIMLAYSLSGNNTVAVWWVTLSVKQKRQKAVGGWKALYQVHSSKEKHDSQKKISFQVFFLYFHLNAISVALLVRHKQEVPIQT